MKALSIRQRTAGVALSAIVNVAICAGLAVSGVTPAPAIAASTPSQTTDPIGLLAAASGLTVHEVRMVLGNDQTAFFEYPIGGDRLVRRFRKAVGAKIYIDIKDRGQLTAADLQRLSMLARPHTGTSLASK